MSYWIWIINWVLLKIHWNLCGDWEKNFASSCHPFRKSIKVRFAQIRCLFVRRIKSISKRYETLKNQANEAKLKIPFCSPFANHVNRNPFRRWKMRSKMRRSINEEKQNQNFCLKWKRTNEMEWSIKQFPCNSYTKCYIYFLHIIFHRCNCPVYCSFSGIAHIELAAA